jgi:hypothetical protein
MTLMPPAVLRQNLLKDDEPAVRLLLPADALRLIRQEKFGMARILPALILTSL